MTSLEKQTALYWFLPDIGLQGAALVPDLVEALFHAAAACTGRSWRCPDNAGNRGHLHFLKDEVAHFLMVLEVWGLGRIPL